MRMSRAENQRAFSLRHLAVGAALSLAVTLLLLLVAALLIGNGTVQTTGFSFLPPVCALMGNLVGSTVAAYCAAGRRLPCALLCGLIYLAALLLLNMLVISEGFSLSKLAAVGLAVLLSSLLGGILSAWLPHKRKNTKRK